MIRHCDSDRLTTFIATLLVIAPPPHPPLFDARLGRRMGAE
jgi:hypothetical protein